MIDTGDVHTMMIGAAGVGKTAYWLYPCLEYALASGMSFLSTDTRGGDTFLTEKVRRGAKEKKIERSFKKWFHRTDRPTGGMKG